MIVLTRAVEASALSETQRIISQIRLNRLEQDMANAKKVALRTSGQRGKKARDEEIKAEERVKDAIEAYVTVHGVNVGTMPESLTTFRLQSGKSEC